MGKASLEWRNQREFAFHQNLKEPFYFERPNHERIFPKSMYTDGGSIPRIFWGISGYSPWEYGPAFLIHDWLFMAHHLGDPDYQKYDSVDKAADVMAECLKTLMEEEPRVVKKDIGRIYRMDLAVRSIFAKRVWKNREHPRQPPDIEAEQRQQSRAKLERRAHASKRTKFDALGLPIMATATPRQERSPHPSR
jgi:hypothetical protein